MNDLTTHNIVANIRIIDPFQSEEFQVTFLLVPSWATLISYSDVLYIDLRPYWDVNEIVAEIDKLLKFTSDYISVGRTSKNILYIIMQGKFIYPHWHFNDINKSMVDLVLFYIMT